MNSIAFTFWVGIGFDSSQSYSPCNPLQSVKSVVKNGSPAVSICLFRLKDSPRDAAITACGATPQPLGALTRREGLGQISDQIGGIFEADAQAHEALANVLGIVEHAEFGMIALLRIVLDQ